MAVLCRRRYKMKIILSFMQIMTNLSFVVEVILGFPTSLEPAAEPPVVGASFSQVPWPDGFRKFLDLFQFVNLDFMPWQSLGCVTVFTTHFARAGC
jgi:hypothetical protein